MLVFIILICGFIGGEVECCYFGDDVGGGVDEGGLELWVVDDCEGGVEVGDVVGFVWGYECDGVVGDFVVENVGWDVWDVI